MATDRSSRPGVRPYVGRGPKGTLIADEARALLDEQARSGLTFQEFALSKGLVPQRLQWWKTKFARQAVPPAPPATFVPVTVAGELPAETSRVLAPGRGFVLRVRDAHALEIPADFDAAALARLLRVLAEAP